MDCKFISLTSDLLLASPTQLPESFVTRLVNLLSLGSVQAAVASSEDGVFDDFCDSSGAAGAAGSRLLPQSHAEGSSPREAGALDDGGSTRWRQATTKPSENRIPRCGLGIAVRQTSYPSSSAALGPHLSSPTGGGAAGASLANGALSLDLDRLRQYDFRENFARFCFGRLLAHSFPEDDVGGRNKSSVSVAVSRAAVRSILGRCRQVLVNFFQASVMTGKCPLPRARLAEVAFVFRALSVMLTSLCSVSSRQDVDPSTWRHVIDIYPHLVDCILVTGGSQLTVSLHKLLRLYGDLLQPGSPTPSPAVNGS